MDGFIKGQVVKVEVLIDGVRYVPEKTVQNNAIAKTLCDVMLPYVGAEEYTGIVAECQTWYYGRVVKAAWCATWVSFCLDKMGLLSKCVGKKQENVYNLWNAMRMRCKSRDKKQIQRGDVVFLKLGVAWNVSAAKHVCVAVGPVDNFNKIQCIGGNQSDKVQISTYDADKIYDALIPLY